MSFAHWVPFHCLDVSQSVYPLTLWWTKVASKMWQLRIKLLYTSLCRFLCGHEFSPPLGEYQGKSLLWSVNHHTVSQVAARVAFPAVMRVLAAPQPWCHLVVSAFQVLAVLISVFAYFLIVLLLLNCRSSVYILVINTSSHKWNANISSQTVGLLFTL